MTVEHLTAAARQGDLSQVLELLKEGRCGKEDLSLSLHEAIRFGHERVALALHHAGARAGVRDASGNTDIHLAAGQGMYDAARVMASECLAHAATWNRAGLTPAGVAAMEGDLAMVQMLVELGAEPLVERLLPLTGCVGDVVLVRWLLGRGVSVDTIDQYGRSALHWAAQEGHAALVDFLLDAGADVSLKDAYGDDALSIAVCEAPVVVVALLARLTFDAPRCCPKALHQAALCGDVATAKLLLDVGYRADALDDDGDSPLGVARECGRADLVVLLEKAVAGGEL